jgi:hypothetical protein
VVSTTDITNMSRRAAVMSLEGCTVCGRTGVLRRGLCGADYEALRRKHTYLGIWDARRAPVGPVLEHIDVLIDAGLSRSAVAALAGTTTTWMRRAARPGRKWVESPVAAAVLAIPVPVAPQHLAPGGSRVDATGTVRRLQALTALGYTQEAVLARLGVSGWGHCLWSGRRRLVNAATARRVERLYEELCMTPAPPSPGATRARNTAARRGYPPPLAWDDIDDPDARPYVPPTVVRPLTSAGRRAVPHDFAEVVADHRALGRSDDAIAAALGLKLDTLQMRLRRAAS